MKSVFLDSLIMNPGDISWAPLEALGELTVYMTTSLEERAAHIGDADAVFMDSAPIDRETMEQCPNLKFIGAGSTGYNHIDLEAAKELGIAVANVPAYSTDSVAQQAMALLLFIANRVDIYNDAVAGGEWSKCKGYTFIKVPPVLLAGKSIGIIGYGNIGKKMAQQAEAFGMKVNIYSKNPQAAVSSDVVSVHCPLTDETEKMIDAEFISKMKDGAILINTARGGLIDEEALAEALKSGKLAAAGLDVLAQEPPAEDHPLIGLDNCFITPHVGFAPREMRKIVCDTCAANLKSFMEGGKLNRLV